MRSSSSPQFAFLEKETLIPLLWNHLILMTLPKHETTPFIPGYFSCFKVKASPRCYSSLPPAQKDWESRSIQDCWWAQAWQRSQWGGSKSWGNAVAMAPTKWRSLSHRKNKRNRSSGVRWSFSGRKILKHSKSLLTCVMSMILDGSKELDDSTGIDTAGRGGLQNYNMQKRSELMALSGILLKGW